MWVRSQDKTKLIESYSLTVEGTGIYSDVNYADSEGCGWVKVGNYETKERALRVLDTIQQRLIAGASKDVIANGTRYSKQFVFQMPQK